MASTRQCISLGSKQILCNSHRNEDMELRPSIKYTHRLRNSNKGRCPLTLVP